MEHFEHDPWDVVDREISRILTHAVQQFQPRQSSKSLISRAVNWISGSALMHPISHLALGREEHVYLSVQKDPWHEVIQHGPTIWGLALNAT